MKLSDQVCSLEQAKRLAELGLSCLTPFRWRIYKTKKGKPIQHEVITQQTFGMLDGRVFTELKMFPAFTVAELGAMLPTHIGAEDYEEGERLEMEHQPGQWYFCYAGYKTTSAATEAQARAAMLIYLLESGTITATEVNVRLIS